MRVNKKEIWRVVKFTLFSISAGLIEIGSASLLQYVILNRFIPNDASIHFITDFGKSEFIAATIGLALSILWNFTFNRKFTFKAANNVPIAMLLAFLFYVPFYPFKIWYVDVINKALEPKIGGVAFFIAEGTSMIINFVLEFLWQQFVVFRGKVDTNKLAQKQREQEAATADENTPSQEEEQ